MAPGRAARWAILGFFALSILVRILAGPVLFYDEAEALYHSRSLAWGYGPQPPLYFWLQWGLFQLLGPSLLSLALLKFGLFAAALVAVLKLGERSGQPAAAAAGALGLSLIPVIGWEAQRAYTHSILALLIAVLATGAVLDAMRDGSWRSYLRLGLLFALGALSKLNFMLWPLALLVASAWLPEWRGRLRPARLLAAAGVAAGLLAVPLAWMLGHPDMAGGSLRKLYAVGLTGPLARLAGTGAMLRSALAYATVAGVALAWLVGWQFRELRARLSARAAEADEGARLARLLLAALVITLAIIWVSVMATGATSIKERWYLPIGWAFVPAGVLAAWPLVTPRRRRAFVLLTAWVWLFGLLNVPFQTQVIPNLRATDYAGLADLLAEAGDRPLLVSDVDIAGNLLAVAPDLSLRLWDRRPPSGAALLLIQRNVIERAIDDPQVGPRIVARLDIDLPRARDQIELALLTLAEPRS